MPKRFIQVSYRLFLFLNGLPVTQREAAALSSCGEIPVAFTDVQVHVVMSTQSCRLVSFPEVVTSRGEDILFTRLWTITCWLMTDGGPFWSRGGSNQINSLSGLDRARV